MKSLLTAVVAASLAIPALAAEPEGFQAAAVKFGEKIGELSAAVQTGDKAQIEPSLASRWQNLQRLS